IAADRADVEIAGQPLVGVTEGDAVVDGLDDGCEVRRLRPNTDAGTAAEVVTAGPTAAGIDAAGSPAAGIDAPGSAVAGIDRSRKPGRRILARRREPVARRGRSR